MADPVLSLTINGRVYSGWTSIRVTRGIDRCSADFDIAVSERWTDAAPAQAWQIAPFEKALVAIDGKPIITGYIDRYMPSYDKDSHTVRISGRSKTGDLVDCMPDVAGGQFNGQTVDRIARQVAAPFGISVSIHGDPGPALPDATLEKCETAFSFIERLARLRSLLACDDENGNLLLTEAGTETASGALIEGKNILAGSATLSANERFKTYAVLSQTPLAFDDTNVGIDIIGTATDPGVPRYRRHAEMAEAPADGALAKKRAKWRALYNYGRSTEAKISLQGWFQPDGSLWKINQLAPVKSPLLALDRTLLVTAVSYLLDEGGHRTELTLAPQEAFTPDPASVKLKKGSGTAAIWSGAVPIQ